MANKRIKDISATATSAANDDYLVIDGTTNGTRKIAVSNVGETMHDFTSSLTPSIDSRGVTAGSWRLTPTDISAPTMSNIYKIQAYLVSSSYVYPLIVTQSYLASTGDVIFYLKSIHGNPQNTTSTTISGTLHVVAPFEISSVGSSM